jgi:hypothetical protein
MLSRVLSSVVWLARLADMDLRLVTDYLNLDRVAMVSDSVAISDLTSSLTKKQYR